MPDQGGGGGGLFAKTGKDSINLFGHKVPIALIGGVAALLTVLLVLRARRSGANVAAVGAAPGSPYTAAASGFGTGSTAPDYSGALANLSAQLTSLSQGLAAPTPAPAPSVPVGLVGGGPEGAWSIPLSTAPGGPIVSWLKPGTQVTLAGAPVAGTYAGQNLLAEPINYLGGNYFVNVDALPPTAARN
jgi:hypothetical protein